MNRNKNFFSAIIGIVLFISLFSSGSIHAQQFGMSAGFEGSMFKYSYSGYNFDTAYTKFRPGIRVAVDYLIPGFGFPASAFNEFGITYFIPSNDSSTETGTLNNGGMVDAHGMRSLHMMDYSLRFAYEIPQSFDDFLMIHFGWGFSGLSAKSTFQLPDRSTAFPYDPADFTDYSFEAHKSFYLEGELLAGATYELEHFTLMAQYNVMVPLSGESVYSLGYKYRHGFKIGVLFAFKKW